LLITTAIYFTLTLFINKDYREENDRAIKLPIENHKNEALLDVVRLEREQLGSLLLICSWCWKIENIDGSWSEFESYQLKQKQTELTCDIYPLHAKNERFN
tara:strand:+ start:447 stop:749 length:303 start_codon:yes stop_codon:yes gene_type:complete